MNKRQRFKLSGILAVLSFINLSMQFVFQWYIVTKLGAQEATDALFAGLAIPQFVLLVISGSLMHVLVPLLSGNDKESIRQDTWSFLFLIGLVFSVLSTVLFFSAPLWIRFIVPGFDKSTTELTVSLTRIQLLGIVLSALNGVQWASYHARKSFIWPQFTPMISTIVSFILLIWLLPKYGIFAAAWILTGRLALQTVLLSTGMGKPKIPRIKDANVLTAWKRIRPLLIGTAYYKTDPILDKYLLSSTSSGILSLYYLSQQLYGAASFVLNKAIATPMVPSISEYYKSKEYGKLKNLLKFNLTVMSLITILSVILLLILGLPIIKYVGGIGRFTQHNFETIWIIMIVMSGRFVFGSIGTLLSVTFYGIGDTKTPTKYGMISYTIAIPIKVSGYYLYGYLGLAFATSLYYLLSILLIGMKLRTKLASLHTY